MGKQGWCSGERVSPPTSVSQVRFPDLASYVGWVCCWLSSLLWGFFSGFSGFPPSTKINTSKFLFDLETVDEEPLRGNAAANIRLFLFYSFKSVGNKTGILRIQLHCTRWISKIWDRVHNFPSARNHSFSVGVLRRRDIWVSSILLLKRKHFCTLLTLVTRNTVTSHLSTLLFPVDVIYLWRHPSNVSCLSFFFETKTKMLGNVVCLWSTYPSNLNRVLPGLSVFLINFSSFFR